MGEKPLGDFSLKSLFDAIDTQRVARGLTWTQTMREINTSYEQMPARPVVPSTVKSLATKAVAEGDGVLGMLRWLNRAPESFLPGWNPETASDADRLPEVPRGRCLRFDVRKIYDALNARRQARGLTWQQVAHEIGVFPSTLTNMSKASRTGFPHVMRITRWLGQPVAHFTRISAW